MVKNVMLGDGTELQCRPVPPHAVVAIHAEYTLPEPPSTPMKQVQSKAGHTEPLPIGPGDEGWEEFRAERDSWHAEYKRIKEEISKREREFLIDFAIVAWKRPGSDAWEDDVPGDWEFPKVLLRHDIQPDSNKRLDYIKYEILKSPGDISAIQVVAVGDAGPLTREEVKAARGKFRDEGVSGRGRPGGSTRGRGRHTDLQHDVLQGDEGGKGVGALARRLVRRITRR